MTAAIPADLLLAPPASASTPIYLCPVCRTAYASAAAAEECASMPTGQDALAVKPGDFVVAFEGYGWAKDHDWVSPVEGYKFQGRKTLTFFFMVMSITHDSRRAGFLFEDNRAAHRPILHLVTGAANTSSDGEMKGLRAGWTPAHGHRHIQAVNQDIVPQKLRDAVAHLIGKTAPGLL